MGKTTGFMEYGRETAGRRPVIERVNDWFEIYQDFPEETLRTQGARCMDCGVPFCHTGCPAEVENSGHFPWLTIEYDRLRELGRNAVYLLSFMRSPVFCWESSNALLIFVTRSTSFSG